ncbi:hypothetical protein ACQY0O_001848 [Thecaphora frezii]
MVLSSRPSNATIPNVVATHLVGDRTLQIARGQLTLQPSPYTLQTNATSASGQKQAQPDAAELPSHHGETDAGVDANLPVLILSVGNATWPLYRSTLFGTHDKDETLYTFLAEMSPPKDSDDLEADSGASNEPPPSSEALPATKASSTATWIRLTLPAAVCAYKSPVQVGRDRMEQLLIEHGLLKSGLAAAADEVASSARQSGQQKAERIEAATQRYLDATPSTALPASFSNQTHRATAKTASATATGASYTHAASEAIADLAASAGAAMGKAFAWTRSSSHERSDNPEVAAASSNVERRPSTSGRRLSLERFGIGRSKSPNPRVAQTSSSSASQQAPGQSQAPPPSTSASDPNAPRTVIQSIGDAASGVIEGTKATGSAALDSAHRVIANDHGDEAAKVAAETGRAVANTGQMAWDATLVTSAYAHGAMASKGVYEGAGADPADAAR